MDLFTTLDEPARYVATHVIEPATTGWLPLPQLHARLLPLAQAAGHERLLLNARMDGPDEFSYEADATGGRTGFRRYIGFFDYGSTPAHFEAALTRLLQQQASLVPTPQQAA